MARSRSLFDLSNAIATAESLAAEEAKQRPLRGQAQSTALVSFGKPASAPMSEAIPPPPPIAATQTSPSAAPDTAESSLGDMPKNPPKLPDLSSITSPMLRCEKIVDWITEATGATDVFLADAAGLPLAGAIHDGEPTLAGSGLVASSIASLCSTLAGSPQPQFELHVGEGPFFQLIGFQIKEALFVVGFTRATPLSPRQAHAIRLACRHALGDALRGGS